MKVVTGRIPTWMLRGGPGQDYPCNNPQTVECAFSGCQAAGKCQMESDVSSAQEGK